MPLDQLTSAEQEMARLVAAGLTNRQIAQRINRSPHTVDSHLRALRRIGALRSITPFGTDVGALLEALVRSVFVEVVTVRPASAPDVPARPQQ